MGYPVHNSSWGIVSVNELNVSSDTCLCYVFSNLVCYVPSALALWQTLWYVVCLDVMQIKMQS